jgi:hypothetical protein
LFLACFFCFAVWFSCEATYAALDEMLGWYGLWRKQLQLVHPQLMDRGSCFQTCRVAANILKDQSQMVRGGGLLLGDWSELNTSSLEKMWFFRMT